MPVKTTNVQKKKTNTFTLKFSEPDMFVKELTISISFHLYYT